MARSSDPKKLAVSRERLERFSISGLGVAQFCTQERVSVASFYHWRKKLGHKGRRRHVTNRPPAGFVCGQRLGAGAFDIVKHPGRLGLRHPAVGRTYQAGRAGR